MAGKILVIDDNYDFVQAVTALLMAENYQVVFASNGKDGYAKAQKEKPDLIVLDVMMTYDSEGLDLSRKLSQDKELKNIPVIMVSGIRKVSDLGVNYETGKRELEVKAMLEKPVNPEQFLKTVKQNIGKK